MKSVVIIYLRKRLCVRVMFSCMAMLLSIGEMKSQVINTVCGTGSSGSLGDNGPAISAEINGPVGLTLDDSGNMYIVDDLNNKIRKITKTTNIITTIAGSGKGGYSGDGGPATAAELLKPIGIIVNKAGDVYVSDGDNQVIRKIAKCTGIITTIAGNGSAGYGGDGGPATAASFFYAAGMAIDSAQNLYIADELNNRIRRVDVATGIVTTVVGDGNTGGAIGNGGPATAAEINTPSDVKFDSVGNMYITDVNEYIRKVDVHTGVISSIAGNGVEAYGGNGGPATAAELDEPLGLALDASGNVYFSDFDNVQIRKVNVATGIITAVTGIQGVPGYTGDGGLADSAQVHWPAYLVVDHYGNLFFADEYNNRIREVTNVDGVREVTTELGVDVYPDPVVRNSFYLTILNKSASEASINIYSITGQCVLSKKQFVNVSPVEVNVSNVPAGIYLLKVLLPDGDFCVKKLIIDK